MRRFASLYAELDATTRTTEKVDAMVRYFAGANPADAAWAVYFLSGGRLKRLIGVRKLAEWAMALADVPGWLFEESYAAVGDLAETVALLLPAGDATSDHPLAWWIEHRVIDAATLGEEAVRQAITDGWRELRGNERFVWNKLLTGNFRVGVSHQLVVRALSRVSGVNEGSIAHRLSGAWTPRPESYLALVTASTEDTDVSRPYPFYLAYALEDPVESLGDVREWQAEWKWDGIRAQLIRRAGQTFIWSRGDELVTERFPEIVEAASGLPDGTVIDGELLPWRDDRPLPFAQMQRRIGRKVLGSKILTEVPMSLVAYDLLEMGGTDLRPRGMAERRLLLEPLVRDRGDARLRLSPVVRATSWSDVVAAREGARELGAEGLMLKQMSSAYGVGRRKGGWWKWKINPITVDAVMVYAQAGHGRRASLNTDYTFAVWNGDALVPFAKAYSGLTDAEIRELDAWIRRNTIEKFGPVRSVPPEQLFELAFEGIQASPRHKSGIAVRFPRILRWRKDKPAREADTLETLKTLLARQAP